MIKLEMDPRIDAMSTVKVDLSWAFDNSKGFPEFVVNAGIEAQAAFLAIISSMYDRINHMTLGKLTKQQANAVKEVLVQYAQNVDVAMLDEFRQDMGKEGRLMS